MHEGYIHKAYGHDTSAAVGLLCEFLSGNVTREKYTLTDDGVTIELCGDSETAIMLPAFCFDGETYTDIICTDNELCIRYEGWECRYTTDGVIGELQSRSARNRNGYYRTFYASSDGQVTVWVRIVKLLSH